MLIYIIRFIAITVLTACAALICMRFIWCHSKKLYEVQLKNFNNMVYMYDELVKYGKSEFDDYDELVNTYNNTVDEIYDMLNNIRYQLFPVLSSKINWKDLKKIK